MCVCVSQVAIPVVSVRLVKKHKTAGLVPNGIAITTDTNQKVNSKTQTYIEHPHLTVCLFVHKPHCALSLNAATKEPMEMYGTSKYQITDTNDAVFRVQRCIPVDKN